MTSNSYVKMSELSNSGKWIFGVYKPEEKIFDAVEGILVINKDFHRIFISKEDIETDKFIFSIPSQNVAFVIEERYYNQKCSRVR